MQRIAITFRVRPGTEEIVKDLLSNYPPPEHFADDGTRLVSTSVFMKEGRVVRMMEIDGELPGLIKHISQQPSIQQVERELDKYVIEEDRRDWDAPGGAQAFFRRALMETVMTRHAALGGADA